MAIEIVNYETYHISEFDWLSFSLLNLGLNLNRLYFRLDLPEWSVLKYMNCYLMTNYKDDDITFLKLKGYNLIRFSPNREENEHRTRILNIDGNYLEDTTDADLSIIEYDFYYKNRG